MSGKNNDKNIMPAYEEMLVTERKISDGVTGRKAYAGFAERVKLPCYQKLVRIILQSIHKGSKGVCEMLEKESEDAFDERRLLALKLGEEAGTKNAYADDDYDGYSHSNSNSTRNH